MSKQPSQRPRRRPPPQSLKQAMQQFLTPALWKQAEQARQAARRGRRAKTASRRTTQPLVLVLLFMTWTVGDSQPERFATARAFCQVCLPKRRRPGRTVPGYQKALAHLPLRVLRILAAGLRRTVPAGLATWTVRGFVPIGCDGSRLECPRTSELEARLGQAGKDGSAPTLWVTALVHLGTGVPWAWRFGKGTASERAHLLHLLPLLPAAALLVTDAGYFGFDLVRQLVQQRVQFLLRMSSNVTLYAENGVAVGRYRQGIVYYFPAAKEAKRGVLPLRLRLIRVCGRRRQHDVWLLTNVLDKQRLSRHLAGQLYRWRWENEGLFRTYKHTLHKVRLVSRTVALVHREAEGSWLALQLLLAQGALAQRPAVAGQPTPVTSARQVLLAVRAEMLGQIRRGQPRYWERLQRAQRERRSRRSAKETRLWPRRKPHKALRPPKLLKLTDAQKALINSIERPTA